MKKEIEKRTGFVAIVGPSNSGKSTFLNAALGTKVSIVSHRPQTTLRAVKGILNEQRGQMIFVDTPGLVKRDKLMSRSLNRLADEQAKGCDVAAWMFDASLSNVLDRIRNMQDIIKNWKPKAQSLCILNKVDKVDRRLLLPLLQEVDKLGLFQEMIPIAARRQDGVDRVVDVLFNYLPVGDPLYPDDKVTDRSEDFLISEIIREKVYKITRQEIPYSVRVDIERYEGPTRKDIPHFLARVHSDSDSRKGILIGKKGDVLKQIGSLARQDVERLLNRQVCLKLQVDVEKDWRRDERLVQRYLEIEV
ncbi:MAG: GTPase Era [Bdellovibrionaceae bacterium]|nr:GTPase Era [Bdellovibrionales bacterium]MCB9254912.1 GTPase Era [Pseudobdellovibrionaceae bacterium]